MGVRCGVEVHANLWGGWYQKHTEYPQRLDMGKDLPQTTHLLDYQQGWHPVVGPGMWLLWKVLYLGVHGNAGP